MVVGLAALAVFGIVTTLAVTWSFQRFVIPPDPAARAAGLRTQLVVSDTIGRPPPVRMYRTLPSRAPGEVLAIVGPCDGLYQGQADGGWSPIEVAARRGNLSFTVERHGPLPGKPEVVVAFGPPADTVRLTLVHQRGATRFVMVRNGVESKAGKAVDLAGGDHHLQIRADPTFTWSSVYLDGREVLFVPGTPPVSGAPTKGVGPALVVTSLPSPTPTCDLLLAAHR